MMTGSDELHVDLWHIGQADRLVVVEVRLLDVTVLKGQSLRHDLARAPKGSTLDLRRRVERIDDCAGVHCNGDAVDFEDASLGIDRDFSYTGDPSRALPLLGR